MPTDLAETQIIVADSRVIEQALTYFTTPEQIEALEGELLSVGSIDVPVKHSFCKGVYARQITIPKWTFAIGHAHSDECLNIVTAGSVSVVLDGIVTRVTAPACFVSAPFQRKVGFVHDDLTWITVHATDEKDIKKLEADLIIKSETFKTYEALAKDGGLELATCGNQLMLEDRLDYFKALDEIGFTHEQAVAMSESQDDIIPMPVGTGSHVYIGSSKISGEGLFLAFDCEKDSILCLARIAGNRTPAGRYTNHSKRPNCIFVPDENGDVHLVSVRDVKAGEELTVDYRQARAASMVANSALKNNTQ